MQITAYICVVYPMFLVYIEYDCNVCVGMIVPTLLANKHTMPIFCAYVITNPKMKKGSYLQEVLSILPVADRHNEVKDVVEFFQE